MRRGVREEVRARKLYLGEDENGGGVSPKLSEFQPRDDSGAGLKKVCVCVELFVVSPLNKKH